MPFSEARQASHATHEPRTCQTAAVRLGVPDSERKSRLNNDVLRSYMFIKRQQSRQSAEYYYVVPDSAEHAPPQIAAGQPMSASFALCCTKLKLNPTT